MEINENGFLEELLALGRETLETNPIEANGSYSSTWDANGFYGNPASVLPNYCFEDYSTSITSLDCSFNEIYSPYGARFPAPETAMESLYTNQLCELPFSAQEDYSFSIMEEEDQPGSQRDLLHGKVDTTQSAEIQAINMGLCMEGKNKVKRLEGQPSKNLMAERRRRKRLNDRLSMLRSVVPKISKMDRTSILGDTIDYMKELLDKISNLQQATEESSSGSNAMSILGDIKPNDLQMRNSPKFDVERRNMDTRVEICCAGKPGLLLSTVSTLEALGLDIQQCVISCFSDFSLQASCSEEWEQRKIISSEDIKEALFRNAGYGGMCQ
ncbi:hypothetical protein Nepgr_019844 [Nepenthes gracilis]|uniref:BHLH domain-containing protein n=1 Tax=Nepenthes gracilis TaxID=150966 RepID=A0AAD3SU51_NEPGR|nr:hypothetical protein Nepgr_019844 [Nepenthes gracilis]